MSVTHCPACQGLRNPLAIREHNLRCADYGERVYLGRDDPRMPVPYSAPRKRLVKRESDDA
jgi:hypothetical protein